LNEELKALCSSSVAAAGKDSADKISALKKISPGKISPILQQLGQNQKKKNVFYWEKSLHGSRVYMKMSKRQRRNNV
jgi:predicted adenine nucleotide alpha hydrolase (AANH) superfamily ATPase